MLYRPTQQDYESFRQGLKTGFSPDTSVFSALETFVIIALYKSAFTIPYWSCRREKGVQLNLSKQIALKRITRLNGYHLCVWSHFDTI